MNKLKIEIFKKDIEAKIKNIDIWLDENKEYFDLYRISDNETTFLHRKSFCEYSLYLLVCNNHTIKSKSKIVEKQFFDQLKDEKFLQLAKANRELFLAFGLPIAVAKHLGVNNTEHENYFADELYSQHARSLELVPFRMMDYIFATQIHGDLAHIFPVKSLYAMSNFTRLPDPIHTDESQAYALTHNVFYLTGMRKCHDFLDVGLRFDHGIVNSLEALLIKYIAKQDLDVSLELLASLALTGHCKEWHMDLVFCEIAKVMQNDTIIPGPVGRMGDDVKQRHGEKFQTWAKNYHTMLVAAMCLRIIYDQLDDIFVSADPVDLKLIYSLGHSLRLADEYNLPLLLTVLKSLETDREAIEKVGLGHVIDNTVKFVNSQRNERGYIGYFHDEKLKNQSKCFETSVHSTIKKIDDCIDWKKLAIA